MINDAVDSLFPPRAPAPTVNGEWSPEVDTFIPKQYSADTIEDKLENKRALLSELGMPFRS